MVQGEISKPLGLSRALQNVPFKIFREEGGTLASQEPTRLLFQALGMIPQPSDPMHVTHSLRCD